MDDALLGLAVTTAIVCARQRRHIDSRITRGSTIPRRITESSITSWTHSEQPSS